MADIRLTPSQQAVVDDRGGALLVSAAAGSGKTKVLVDRILGRISDPVHPCNIDDFLVITYTNAAAAELRAKITQALNQKLAQMPENRHLQKQLRRVYLAEISTVHAFCGNLLRTYAHQQNIPADFRIAEEMESQILRKKVLADLLEEGYAAAEPSFLAMVDAFGYGRNDNRLPETVEMAYQAMQCRVNMDQWLQETTQALEITQYEDAGQTPWGAYLIRELHRAIPGQISALENCKKELAAYPKIEKSFQVKLDEMVTCLQELAGSENWDTLRGAFRTKFAAAKPLREPEDLTIKEKTAQLCGRCVEFLKKWNLCFYADSETLLRDLTAAAPAAQELFRFTKTFTDRYRKEKQRRKLMDFSDLEHEAVRLLVDRYTGRPSRTAKEISARYEEILVDEYQDSNQVQETIFEAVSKDGQNRFMVGDVKQSIYSFRLADPSLFLHKYEEFPLYTEAAEGMPRKIVLSDNFRSRPEILEACNFVFRLIMRREVGDLEYGPAEMLRPGRPFPKLDDPLVELHCLTNSLPQEGSDKREEEATFVAARIRKMLDDQELVTDGDGTRPVRPSDIVILLRSVANTAPAYLRALKEQGIPAVCSREENLIDATEIQVLIAFLQILDNPHQDVPLLTVLASPLFAFSSEDLASARLESKRTDLYDAICASEDRFGEFLSMLHRLREQVRWLSIPELLDRVFRETGMMSVFSAMPDGLRRERNLQAFRSFAAAFEAVGGCVLSQLLLHISEVAEHGGRLESPKGTTEHSVVIMSIHKSKGLEFPVVFLSDLSHQFNLESLRETILVDDTLAVGYNRVDQERYVRYPTLAKKSIVLKKEKQMRSEELRILYVAMTRAKDRLIMTYYSKRLLAELAALNSQLTMPLSDEACAGVNNPGKWILMAALCRTEAGPLHVLTGGNDVSFVQDMPWLITYSDLSFVVEQERVRKEDTKSSVSVDPRSLELLQCGYSGWKISNVPSKLTATQLKGRIQDEEASEQAAEVYSPPKLHFRKAAFSPKQLTAAEKGTATHLFLQFAKYDNCLNLADIQRELDRLVREEFLSREQALAVRSDQVLQFFCSELGRWLVSQKELRREFKFSLLEDAGQFYQEAAGETVMLQGVVDCFVLEKDGITILDFKTDLIQNNLEARAEYYRPQITAYAGALSKIFEKPVKKRILYFFSAGEAVYV